MNKNKIINLSVIVKIVKSCLIGVVSTILLTIVFAFVLKFVNISARLISYLNDLIKLISIFITIVIIKKKNNNKLLIQSIFSGVIYAFLVHLIFSILNGSVSFGLEFIYDLLFCVIVSGISSVIINVFGTKTV